MAERQRVALAGGESAEDIAKGNQYRFACDCSNGACHDLAGENGPLQKNQLKLNIFHTFSQTPRGCMAYLLCEKEHIPQLDLRELDKNDRETENNVPFMSFQKKCCFGNCRQVISGADIQTTRPRRCGWNGRFSALPNVRPCVNVLICSS